jgi:hypothetical protein
MKRAQRRKIHKQEVYRRSRSRSGGWDIRVGDTVFEDCKLVPDPNAIPAGASVAFKLDDSWHASMTDYDEGSTFIKQIQKDFLTGCGLPTAFFKKDT